jgi:exopolyphosphatase/pppGpp-phosphohydrolase
MEQRLRIDADQTTLGFATLRIGWRSLARDYFKSDPPSPLDLENAIAAIEDEIARARAGFDPARAVVTTEQSVREIAHAAGATPVLAIEAVEHAYARLAGRAGLPGDAKLAATLLILRELMHHLQIERIAIEPR